VHVLLRETEVFTFQHSLCKCAFCSGFLCLPAWFPLYLRVYSERDLPPGCSTFLTFLTFLFGSVSYVTRIRNVPSYEDQAALGRECVPTVKRVMASMTVSNSEKGITPGRETGGERPINPLQRVMMHKEAGNINQQ